MFVREEVAAKDFNKAYVSISPSDQESDDRPATIRPSEVQAWVTRLAGTLSPSTVQVVHGILAAVFKAAIRDRKINASPCESTKSPRKPPKEVVPLSTEAVQAIAAACRSDIERS
jgi:integrase